MPPALGSLRLRSHLRGRRQVRAPKGWWEKGQQGQTNRQPTMKRVAEQMAKKRHLRGLRLATVLITLPPNEGLSRWCVRLACALLARLLGAHC